MAFSINKAILLGNLTRDPELRHTPSNKAVATLNMATNHSVKNQDGSYVDVPTFHRIIVWGKMAEFVANNCRKGTKIYVDGRITTREYEDKQGQKQRSREIIADNVIPMSESQARRAVQTDTVDGGYAEEPNAVENSHVEDVNPDDIPF